MSIAYGFHHTVWVRSRSAYSTSSPQPQPSTPCSVPLTRIETVNDMVLWDTTPCTMRWLLPKFRREFVFPSPGHEKGQSSGSRFFRKSENHLPNLTDEWIIICLIFAHENFANIYFVYACFTHFSLYGARKFLTYVCVCVYMYIYIHTYIHTYIHIFAGPSSRAI